MSPVVTSEIVLKAYAAGIFPMAEDENDPCLQWINPRERGIIPLEYFHVGKRLSRTIRSDHFTIRVDTNFPDVIAGCAATRYPGSKTWINHRIRNLFGELFTTGYCHTVEVYSGEQLVGGLYGIALGSAFFGESMFHTERDASKVALAYLVARLRLGGFVLLDTQFYSDHLSQFGAIEIPRHIYRKLLNAAIERPADWSAGQDTLPDGQAVLSALADQAG